MASTVKRLGEEWFFSEAFGVFGCICAFFLRVLFGGKEIFRIFANDKGISISTIPPSSKNYLWSVSCNALNHNGLWCEVR